MQHRNWKCPKCSNRNFETGQISGTGGFFSKFFNIQSQEFTTILCSRCTYTEMCKGEILTSELREDHPRTVTTTHILTLLYSELEMIDRAIPMMTKYWQ